MMKKLTWIVLGVLIGLCAAVFRYDIKDAVQAAASHMDRLVLGSGNYGTDPNTTADITGQNDEYISNATDGTWDAGAAALATTGNITTTATLSAEQLTSTDDATIGDDLTVTDSVSVGEMTNTEGKLRFGNSVGDGGRIMMYVTAHSAVSANMAVVWDTTAVLIENDWTDGVEVVTAGLDANIATKTSYAGYYVLYFDWVSGTTTTGDSVCVKGTELDEGEDFVCWTLLTAGNDHTANTTIASATEIYRWTEIDSIKGISIASNVFDIKVMPCYSVKPCDGANADIAGVAEDAIADETSGYIVTHGIAKCLVDAATNAAGPGVLLEGVATGTLITDEAGSTSKNIARACEYSHKDNTIINVMVDAY